MAQVKVTLVKSLAGRPGDQRATIDFDLKRFSNSKAAA